MRVHRSLIGKLIESTLKLALAPRVIDFGGGADGEQEVALAQLGSRSEAKAYGVPPKDLPALLLFDNGIPEVYQGDVNSPKEILQWVREEIK